MAQRQRLSPNSVQVLISIAAGRTYPQILKRHPHLTYLDITETAKEAMRLDAMPPAPDQNTDVGEPRIPNPDHMKELKSKHPKAYQRWTADEELKVVRMHMNAKTPDEIAAVIQRTPVAVRLRLVKLGWIEEPFPSEEERIPEAPSVAVNAPANADARPNPLPAAQPSGMADYKLKHCRSHKRWTADEETRLATLHRQGKTLDELATAMQRRPEAVRLRLETLGLLDGASPPKERQLIEPKVVPDTTSTAGARLQSMLAARSGGDHWRLWTE